MLLYHRMCFYQDHGSPINSKVRPFSIQACSAIGSVRAATITRTYVGATISGLPLRIGEQPRAADSWTESEISSNTRCGQCSGNVLEATTLHSESRGSDAVSLAAVRFGVFRPDVNALFATGLVVVEIALHACGDAELRGPELMVSCPQRPIDQCRSSTVPGGQVIPYTSSTSEQ